MPGVREKLNAFLDKAASKPFMWGVSDCVLEVADWLDYACEFQIAQDYRGTYWDEESANARMPDGLEAAMRAKAVELGLAEAVQPHFGDVAVVMAPNQEKPLAAILMPSGRWRMKTMTGVVLTRDVTVLVAWEIPCRPSSPPR